MDFVIQRASSEDVAEIDAIMRETESRLPRREFFVADDWEYVERHIDEEGFSLLARHDGECAAFLIIDLPGGDEKNLGRDLGWPADVLKRCAHIDSVCVRPAFRGRGLQKRLVEDAEIRLEGMGITRYLATVHPENTASLKSMLALGYQIGATKPKYGGLPRHILFKIVGEEE